MEIESYSKNSLRHVVLRISCCPRGLYGHFCHGALKRDMSTLFARFSLNLMYLLLVRFPYRLYS